MAPPSASTGSSGLSAFTLIELSVVLVVIALIVAGILVGTELIKTAEIRASIRQVEGYQSAVHAFRSKYNCLPGDCKEAAALGLGISPGPGDDGDGNSEVGSTWDGNLAETLNFWHHLARAGMSDGHYVGSTGQAAIRAGTEYPALRRSGAGLWASIPDLTFHDGVYEAQNRSNFLWIISAEGVFYTGSNNQGALTPFENWMIDAKIDDGLPLSGGVTLSAASFWFFTLLTEAAIDPFGASPAPFGAGGADSDVCGDTSASPPVYNVLNASHAAPTLCVLAIRAGF
ncbi:MAG: prepilin-type N-terminal cleavage/methylation domain-containing protein [Planctomycetia bacterium]|nr:MAG: prepilin-type N-terminal cleavage/methylation domain-containing protein [Planctomycetia bacterium]